MLGKKSTRNATCAKTDFNISITNLSFLHMPLANKNKIKTKTTDK